MKKYEYLSELEKRLSALPADARRDALNYYEEYFDAAGPDNEDATAAELGDPAEAARKILEGEGLTPDADPAAPESARGGALPPPPPAPPAGAGRAFRAHGGCLGAGGRRRAREAAIVPGEPHSGFDPGVPEWGNPPDEGPAPAAEHIGREEATGGTETSKYPEERKSTQRPPE